MRVLCIILAAVWALAMPVFAQGPGPTVIYEVKIADITVVGNFEDWAGVQVLSTTDNLDNLWPVDDISGEMMMAWNGEDKWYIAVRVTDDVVGFTTATSSFSPDETHGQGVTRYWHNDNIEILFQDDPDQEAFKLVMTPDEVDRILYQTGNMRHWDWIDFGNDINPTVGAEGKERWPKVPPVATTVVKTDGANWSGEAALTIVMVPPEDPGIRYNFSFNDVEGTEETDRPRIDAGGSLHFANNTGGNGSCWDAMNGYWAGDWESPMNIMHFVDEKVSPEAVEASTWGQVKAAF